MLINPISCGSTEVLDVLCNGMNRHMEVAFKKMSFNYIQQDKRRTLSLEM